MASKILISRAQVHVPVTCTLCDSIEAVNWFCNDCQEVMCDKCKDVHQRGKKTRNDDVVPIQEADKQGKVLLPEVCKTHPGKTLELFCKECLVVMCSMCFTQKHNQHTVGHIEEEMESQKRYAQEQLETLNSKLYYFSDHRSKRHEASKTFRESLDVVRKDVQAQGLMLKAEIDSIVTSILVELSSLAAEEDESCKQDCQPDEKHVKDITQLIGDIEQKAEQMSSTELFELTGRLRNTVPLYDVTGKSVHVPQRTPSLVTGQLDTKQLKEMIGYVSARYEKKEVDSRHVLNLSMFRVPHQNTIISICPTEDSQAWMSVHESTELIKVNKE
ncbi:E3 ubiquitin-protein ligase TRIM33-like, partial [Mizuhopecten yessoensis]|uniref:E3 ubiquitin-protein ligase TRIM33-like n=1 Tax=Mizuhopecten yessoensis TaxID=6573 RepID=UPI000B458CF9